MGDWVRRYGAEHDTWQECSILPAAQTLAKRIDCRFISRWHVFRGRLFRERIAEMVRLYTNLDELVDELPLCEAYQERYGPLCCDAMVDLTDPTQCTALGAAVAVLREAASAAAVKKYRLWRMGVYD